MSTNPTSSELDPLVSKIAWLITSQQSKRGGPVGAHIYTEDAENAAKAILDHLRAINTVLTATPEPQMEICEWCNGAGGYPATPGEAGLREEVERLKDVLRLHDAYLAVPADRGGSNGPKGKACQAFEDAKRAALTNGGGNSDV